MAASGMGARYDTTLDRNSAHEMLARRTAQARDADLFEMPGAGRGRPWPPEGTPTPKSAPRSGPKSAPKPAASRSDSIVQTFGKSLARQLGTRTGQALVRGVLGSLVRKR